MYLPSLIILTVIVGSSVGIGLHKCNNLKSTESDPIQHNKNVEEGGYE